MKTLSPPFSVTGTPIGKIELKTRPLTTFHSAQGLKNAPSIHRALLFYFSSLCFSAEAGVGGGEAGAARRMRSSSSVRIPL
jgi:hypothetical protein